MRIVAVLAWLSAASAGLSGCSLTADWSHRSVVKEDFEQLLKSQGLHGLIRACQWEPNTKTGTCLWEASSGDADELVRGLKLEPQPQQGDTERWQARARCTRYGRDPETKVYGAFGSPYELNLPSGHAFDSLIMYVPPDVPEICLQAGHAEGQ
jgi:hypothetical protein